MERTIIVSSDHKINRSDTNANFSIKLAAFIGSRKLRRLILREVSFTHSIPNLTSDMNLFVRVASSTGDLFAINFGQAQVTAQEFCDMFVATFNNAVTGAQALTATVSAKGFISLTFTSAVYILSENQVLALNGKQRSINSILGFNQLTQPAVGSTSFTAPSICSFAGPSVLHVHSNALAQGCAIEGDNSHSSVLCVVHITSEYGQRQYFQSPQTLLHSLDFGDNTSLPETIDISLRHPADDSVVIFQSGDALNLSLVAVFD